MKAIFYFPFFSPAFVQTPINIQASNLCYTILHVSYLFIEKICLKQNNYEHLAYI